MAGAAQELRDAIIVNPNDVDGMKDAILKALEMPADEQLKRMKRMQKIVSSQTVQKWATDYIDELLSLKKQNEKNNCKSIR